MGRQIVLVAVIQAVGNQSHRQNDARQHGAQEQLRHGHIGDAGVHDQHNGGRNDGTQDGGDGRYAHGEGGGIALPLHGGDGDAADGGGGGHAGAGDSAEQGGGQNGHQGQAALDVSYNGITNVNQFSCNTAGHDIARQNEEGDGQQGAAVHAREHSLRQHNQGQVRQVQGRQGADAQGDVDGESQEGETQQQNDD